MISPLECLFDIGGHEAPERIPRPGYNTLLLWLILDVYSACTNRHFYTLPSLLLVIDSSGCTVNPMQCLRAEQGGSLYHFYDVFGMTLSGREHKT